MTLQEIHFELGRLGAVRTKASSDTDFAPEVGKLVKVELENAYWHLFPEKFLTILRELPDGAGDDAVRVAIERNAMFVWHGPSPKGSRDTLQ